MKPNLLFIGHNFHAKTKSNLFMVELIEKYYHVKKCSFEPDCYESGAWLSSLNGQHFDVIVCWQVMPSITAIKKHCSFDHGVFFPMADYYYLAKKDVSNPVWEQYKDFQIISFCKKMHDELLENGFSSHYFQYFPEPVKNPDWGDEKSVFFWQRVTHVNIYSLLTILEQFSIKKIHFHRALDPFEEYIPLPYEYQGDKEIVYSKWFEHQEDMLKVIDGSSIYVLGRYCEGIGMSFLEAMAHGRCVFVPDAVTFNEYITHGKNGFLFVPSAPKKIPYSDVRTIQKNAYKFICDGYEKWITEREKIISLFSENATPDAEKMLKVKSLWVKSMGNWSRNSYCFIKKMKIVLAHITGNGYRLVSQKQFCGIRYFSKRESLDRQTLIVYFLGFPVFSVKMINED